MVLDSESAPCLSFKPPGGRASPHTVPDDLGPAHRLCRSRPFRRQQDVGFDELHRLAGRRRREVSDRKHGRGRGDDGGA